MPELSSSNVLTTPDSLTKFQSWLREFTPWLATVNHETFFSTCNMNCPEFGSASSLIDCKLTGRDGDLSVLVILDPINKCKNLSHAYIYIDLSMDKKMKFSYFVFKSNQTP